MSARQVFNNIARRRLVPPKPQKSYVKWYMSWADTAHKAVVLTCVGVTGTSLLPSLLYALATHFGGWLTRRSCSAGERLIVVYYGVGVVYMFIQSRKNKGELRKKLIEVRSLHTSPQSISDKVTHVQ